ncbi:MAG: hypothetical protein QM582_02925 [Micropruina sp.]|uniref:hypothetical protein n=1 Tax=Micropruina sp. TaxID=2737536 RepID=UPI0039E3C00F
MLVLLVGCISENAAPMAAPSSSVRPVFVGTRTEYMRAMVDCLKSRGVEAYVEVGVEGDPMIKMRIHSRQDVDAQVQIHDECEAVLPKEPEPTTDADFRQMYEHKLAEIACVKKEGYEVPRTLSWQVFLEQAKAQNLDWDPTSEVPEQLRTSVRKTCNTDPDRWW